MDSFHKLLESVENLGLSEGEYLKMVSLLKKAYESDTKHSNIIEKSIDNISFKFIESYTNQDIEIKGYKMIQDRTSHVYNNKVLVHLIINGNTKVYDISDFGLLRKLGQYLIINKPTKLVIKTDIIEQTIDLYEYLINENKHNKENHSKYHTEDEEDCDCEYNSINTLYNEFLERMKSLMIHSVVWN